jgi:hypothetical protein
VGVCDELVASGFLQLSNFRLVSSYLNVCFAKKEFGDNNENECFSSEASALRACKNGSSHFWYIFDFLPV